MTVATPRQVARGRANFWQPDQVGKALSPTMCFWLRRLPHQRHQLPGVVMRALARRGLLADDAGRLELTPAGERVKALLGRIPKALLDDRLNRLPEVVRRTKLADHLGLGPLETESHCDECRRTVPAELRAYGLTTPTCIRCATKEEA